MYKEKKIAVVIPAYNEEKLILKTLESVPDYVDKVYVVNDYSTDKTQESIESYLPKDSRVISIIHEINKGVGAAIVSGYKASLEDGYDITVILAGDYQMDTRFFVGVIDPVINGIADYTVGNRFSGDRDHYKGMTKWRFFGSSILTLLNKIASGYWQLMDPQQGYCAISRRALAAIDLDSVYPRYGYCNDILVKLNVCGFRVKNVPIKVRYGEEKSKIRYGNYIRTVSMMLLRNFIWRMKMKYIIHGFHPLVFYYFFGTIFSVIGVIGGIVTLIEKFVFGYNILFVHGMLSLLMFTLGMMFLFFAMVFDMQAENADYGWY